MSFNNDQIEPNMPMSNSELRKSINLLPKYYRTKDNKKFLQGTLDQLTQPGTVKKLTGYIGRAYSRATTKSDIFLSAADQQRQDYQLEPAAVVKDYLGNTTFYKDYIDFVNGIEVNDGITTNHSRLTQQEFYSWNPHICWDKFVNFQQYYWLPFGPDAITVSGQQLNVTSEFAVNGVDEGDNTAFLFGINGLTRNPTVTLFRGQTYVFDINAAGHPFSIKTERVTGTVSRYNTGVDVQAVENGKITFTVPNTAPDTLFYVSENSVDTGGMLRILDIDENTRLDIERDVLGKKNYTISTGPSQGTPLSNGMKLTFDGLVFPEMYSKGYWYVEGVGTAIRLISERDLEVRSSYTEDQILLFDDVPFDQLPFSESTSFPSRPDYITINRSSLDNNPWSRYNRWFHKDVIEISARFNGKQPELNQAARAIRPIIEFAPDIKLYNYGIKSKPSVDVIDTYTTDVFSTIEGSIGYSVDGIDLADGMRVLFTADTDRLVRNKIFKVSFISVQVTGSEKAFDSSSAINLIDNTLTLTTEHGLTTGDRVVFFQNSYTTINGLQDNGIYYVEALSPFKIKLFKDKARSKPVVFSNLSTGTHKIKLYQGVKRQIHLSEEADSEPILNECVSVRFGKTDTVSTEITGNQGQNYWFNGTDWKLCQRKSGINTPPLFDLYDSNGVSYTDTTVYEGSNFTGTKIFTYKVGSGAADTALSFPLSYKNINNIGDIVFNFNLLADSFVYKETDQLVTKSTDSGFVKVSRNLDQFTLQNGWETSQIKNAQPIVRNFKNSSILNNFPIDVFNDTAGLEDLSVAAYIKLDNELVLISNTGNEYSMHYKTGNAYITFSDKVVDESTIVTIKYSSLTDSTVYELEVTGTQALHGVELSNYIPKLDVRVYVNGIRLSKTAFAVKDTVTKKVVILDNDVTETDVVTLKIYSKKPKNSNGHYEIPINFQNNPLNDNVLEFTLGQVADHVDSIADNVRNFVGVSAGSNNLRDLGNISGFGTRFVQHSGPLNLPLYHFGSKSANIVNAISQAKTDYGRFKRSFLIAAENTGIELDPKRHVDYILQQLAKDNAATSAYQLSDMFGYAASVQSTIQVLDPRTKVYPLSAAFNLTSCSNKAVNIYVNNQQAVYGRDYTFGETEFFTFTDSYQLTEGDTVEIYEYETTDGCYCPPTPTKLGLFPKFVPQKYIDNSYLEPVEVIQGHDGSVTIAYGDYRDELLLELERRIFNNIKISYDPEIFDLYNYLPGYSRETAYSVSEFNDVLSKYFYQWVQSVPTDYNSFDTYNESNGFTYNFKGSYTLDGKSTPSSWRGIYQWFFDTDVVNVKPWESLGFSIQPSWWESVYGPAPYTSNNYVLWDDLKDGRVREPGKPARLDTRFARPILKYGTPVNENGNLVSPDQAGFVSVVAKNSEGHYVFGDGYMVEAAWRRSSYYAFSLIQALVLLHPAEMFSRCFDRSRTIKNAAGQLVYAQTGVRIRLKDIVIPSISTVATTTRTFTSGLVNYIADYLTYTKTDSIDQYVSDLKLLTNNIATRLGGFTSKEKYKLLLDSKSPNSSSGVFVPAENYFIDLNVSTAIKKVAYSGIVITRYTDGFELRGYNFDQPYFSYYDYQSTGRSIRVGGISESFTQWASGKQYVAGKIVQWGNSYYRALVNHESGSSFEPTLYTKLASLPVSGGVSANLRANWDKNTIKRIPYGAKIETVQQVVDIIQGYGVYLTDQGFVFEDFNTEMTAVANWETSIKEFLFWESQGWGEGSVLSISPGANKITFKHDTAVVDSLTDTFYNYGICRVDGQKLDPSFLDVYRGDGEFSIEPKNTDYGIYGAVFYLVQKEHVAVLDDVTLFNDTIYDKPAGYRQERIKVIGYVTPNWNGSFDVPGFVYDRAVINSWGPWTDYKLGDIVKHKEFYYSAKQFLVGSESFDSKNWTMLSEKPTAALTPNWEYRVEQFTDFYDLDTDNFDSEQQRLAQHLTGYQKQQYLENIITNDVSQYKFYQGMIAEKGTQNVLSKLFDVLSEDDQESLTFDEEWAFRVGEYGALDTFDEVEFVLDESKFKISPQPLEIVDTTSSVTSNDFVYQQSMSDIYVKPKVFSSDIWQTKKLPSYLRTPGYVRREDVKISVNTLSDLASTDISDYREGDYIWAAFEGIGWNVYRLTRSSFKVVDITVIGTEVTVKFDKVTDFAVGDTIGIDFSAPSESVSAYSVKGFHVVTTVSLNSVTFAKEGAKVKEFTDRDIIIVYRAHSAKAASIDDAEQVLPSTLKSGELLWVDDAGNGDWAVFKHSPKFSKSSIIGDSLLPNTVFGEAIAISELGNISAISSSETSGSNTYSSVTVYRKASTDSPWTSFQIIPPSGNTSEYRVVKCNFSKDGYFLAISYPNALANNGAVKLYEKTSAGFLLVKELEGTDGKYLGSNVDICKVGSDYILAAATVSGVLVFKGSYNSTDNSYSWVELDEIQTTAVDDIAIAENGTMILSDVDASTVDVYLYQDGYSAASQTLTETISGDNDLNYGVNIAITKSGKYIAVGAPLANYNAKADTGRVYVYKLSGDTYQLHQTVVSRYTEVNEQFGTAVEFMNDGQSLVVYSLNSDVERIYNFSDGTTFDNNSLRIVDRFNELGKIDVYDMYSTKFVYSETLESEFAPNTEYGKNLAVSRNTVLVSAAATGIDGVVDRGIVYSYSKQLNSVSWDKVRTQNYKVDISTIKKAFLYNKVSKQIVTYLDVVDTTQGKIPGVADQEIKFKGYYDPAIYTVGDDQVTVDDGMAWTDAQVGMLWWDLSNARFLDTESGDAAYKSSVWNTLYETASIDIYEWVESTVTPAVWSERAGTSSGIAAGISGTPKYGPSTYSVKRKYDNVSQKFTNTYYFWVKNKTTIPNIEGRIISASDISSLIANPSGYGYSCLAFTGANSLSLVNIEKYAQNRDLVLGVQFWTSDYRDNNYHSQWKLLSTNRNTVIPAIIEDKWIHSLVGRDYQNRAVPDSNLPEKMRYGIEYRPRQSMFVNRVEALKQYIERVNSILKNVLVTDNYDISPLMEFERAPSQLSGQWDVVIDTEKELRFINVSNIKKPVLTVSTKDGKISSITIVESGYGYGKARPVPNSDLWYSSDVIITGQGTGASVKTIVNNNGEVVSYEIVDPGENYGSDTYAEIRDYTVLVNTDTKIGSWATYGLNSRSKNWYLLKVQSYDATQYWRYENWYASGYNQYTKIDHLLSNTHELVTTAIDIGSIVKVANLGQGGWVLLKKYNDAATIDYTENFQIVGRQNGTIQFSEAVYSTETGYDRNLLDNTGYDSYNTENLRIIVNTIRNNLLVGELKVEYLKLFFSSVRYALHEQAFLDWAFKTSFVKAQHNVGPLTQPPTYSSDNLEFFESYIKEVKPYRTKVREYVSSYSKLDPSRSSITDFDLLPTIQSDLLVTPMTVSVDSNTSELQTDYSEIDSYPWKHWKDAVGFEITEVRIADQGSGYIQQPVVRIEGVQLDGGTPAKAKAYISSGKVNRIELISGGSRWVSAPEIIIEGGIIDSSSATDQTNPPIPARAVAIIGNSPVRSSHIKIRFDRTSKSYQTTTLDVTEVFTGSIVSGSRVQFVLKWSPNTQFNKYNVTVNGADALKNEYYLTSVESKINGTTRYTGMLVFNTAPAAGSTITVSYQKNFNHLSAVDRINFFYDPQTGQLGKDLSQLMTGVDYGGVSVTGLDLSVDGTWDTVPWGSTAWSFEDSEIEDYLVIVSNQPQYQYRLPYVPAENEQISVYVARNIVINELQVDTAAVIATTSKYRRVRVTTSVEHNLSVNQPVIITSDTDTEFKLTTKVYFVKDRNMFDILLDSSQPTVQVDHFNKINGSVSGVYTRIDDEWFKTANQKNQNAVMTTFVGDGVVDIISLPTVQSTPAFELFENDRLVFRKVTSDGSISSNPDNYDTKLIGGDLAYTTATGMNADDIILDGDDLVSPMTSHAPEEVVPGQIMDTLAVKVYSRPTGGCPNMLFKTYYSDGKQTSYKIGQLVPTSASVIVKIGNRILELETDYTIDFSESLVVMLQPATAGEEISIISVSFSGGNIVDLDFFVADGETTEYITKAEWSSNFNITVLVNGSATDYEIFSTDESYSLRDTPESWRARVGIKFARPPVQNSIINYIIDNSGVQQTASVVKSESLTYKVGQFTYLLSNQLGNNLPIEPNLLVSVNNSILASPSYTHFNIETGQRVYSLSNSRYTTALTADDLVVYLDNSVLIPSKDYTVSFKESVSYAAVPQTLVLVEAGSGYAVGDILTAPNSDAVTDMNLTVTEVDTVGSILSATVSTAGDYDAPLSGVIDLLPVSGPIREIRLLEEFNGGVGYVTPEILFAPPELSGRAARARGIVNANGTIVGAVIIDAGSGYTSSPTATSIVETTSAIPTSLANLEIDAVYTPGVDATCTVDFVVLGDRNKVNITLSRKYAGVKYAGKQLIIGVTKFADYTVGTNNDITLLKNYADDSSITVTSFYNHSILDIHRSVDKIVQVVDLSHGTPAYYEFLGKMGGIFTLDRTVLSGDYVWVVKNGELLVNRKDYFLESDRRTIKLVNYLAIDDVVQIIALSNVVVQDDFGFMQFKDMLNRTHFKRLGKHKSTELVRSLTRYDKEIHVKDGSILDAPNPLLNLPGIIEINGERIEYFSKVGNVLSRITRATLGTGAPIVHLPSTLVQGLGVSETIPYKDTYLVDTFISDGVPTNIAEIENAQMLALADPQVEVPAEYYTVPYELNLTGLKSFQQASDLVEIFVSGYRLKKNEYILYHESNGYPYSPVVPLSGTETSKEGDKKLSPEFEVVSNSAIKLTFVPPVGAKISIVKKQGKVWNDITDSVGTRLVNSQTDIAAFVTAVPAAWPR